MQQYMPKNIIKCFDIIFYCDIERFAEFRFFECTVNEQASCKLEHNKIFVYKKTNYHFLLKNISFWDFWTFHIEWGFLTPNFLCEIDKLLYLRCTLIFLHIFWWTTKYLWYAQVIKKMRKWRICRGGFWNTNIHTEKKSEKHCQNMKA